MGDLVPNGSFVFMHKSGAIRAGDLVTLCMGGQLITKRFLYADKDGIAVECDTPKRRAAFCFDEYVDAVYRVGAIVRQPAGIGDIFRFCREMRAAQEVVTLTSWERSNSAWRRWLAAGRAKARHAQPQ